MVRRIRQFIEREIGDLHEAAYLLAAFALVSQLLGFVRDRMLAAQFGAGHALDAYYAAFRIPDLLFALITTLVSLSVLVPFIIRVIDRTDKEKAVFVNTVFTAVSVVSVLVSAAALVLSRPLLSLMFPALMSGEYGETLVLMTRVMLLQPIILAFSSFFASFIQVYRKFFIYALSPVLYNVGLILGIVVFYPMFGLVGLALGVVAGAVLHMLIQLPTIARTGLRPRFTAFPDVALLKEIVMLSVPRTFALAGNQIIQIVLLALAGAMMAGSISIFSLAFNLQSVPLAIIGMSYSLAAFPTLSRLFAAGHMELFVEQIVKAARHIIFWSIPITVMFIVLRAQIVRTVLGGGAFDWDATRLTAAALAVFALSVVAQSLILLFVRGYYSAGETKKPLMFALISVVVTIVSAILLTKFFNTHEAFRHFIEELLRVEDTAGATVLMLPLAFSIGQLVNAILLWISFDKKYRWFSGALWKTIIHSVSASLVAGVAAFYMLRVLEHVFDLSTVVGIFLQGFIAGIVGLVLGSALLILLRNEEMHIIWKTLHQHIFQAKFVGGE